MHESAGEDAVSEPMGNPKMGWHKVIRGDSRNMKEVEKESAHLIITSPPYWQLKDYGSKEQIGFNDSYEDYVNNLNLVWKECHRVLHKGCRLCVNIGDQFARSVYYGRYKIIPIRTEIIKFCESAGFDYMGAIIWQKVTTCHTTGGATIMGSYPYPRNGIIKLDYEFILIFKKLGNPPKVTKKAKEKSKISREEWNRYFYGHWNFSGEKQNQHIAPFPEELPRRLIKMFSFIGDTVLDPFLGSGTTSVAALNLSRNSIGYEINEDYLPVLEKRMKQNMGLFNQEERIERIEQGKGHADFQEEIKRLPYIFKDPLYFEQKVNPKSLRFDSRIDGSAKKSNEYFTVKKILSPCDVLLDTGDTVKLIGAEANGETNREAETFLERTAKGRKVYLGFDAIRHDERSRLLAYVYLKNRTFINARLIKEGYVAVDTRADYRMKEKFLKLARQERGEPEDKNRE